MLLTEDQFSQTFAAPMRLLPQEAEPPFNFWPYFEEISARDFEGHEFSGDVTYVYEHPSGKFQHVLLNSEEKGIFLAIVLNVPARRVFGHRILNLNALYGVGEPN
ncbi:hypothetical protein [Dokdonella sp.]|uniref:hypothetical protein n=1 Tax=Dokdonella sp. TaxID=2291710 RepID=UPI003C44057F